jgi:glutathione S-transferase
MKLWLASYAPNPRRVAMFLAEKGQGQEIERIVISLPDGDHRTEAYKEKSPLAQTPCLELDDGRTLTESRAICTYLETLYPEPNLMGRDGFERAEIEMWDRRAELMFSMPLMLWVRHGSPILSKVELNQTPAVAEYYHDGAMKMAVWFDALLKDRPFIAGDRFTNADITVLAGMDFAKMMRWRPGEDLPHLKAWRERMAERPCGQTPP